jgi:hypothetical protein
MSHGSQNSQSAGSSIQGAEPAMYQATAVQATQGAQQRSARKEVAVSLIYLFSWRDVNTTKEKGAPAKKRSPRECNMRHVPAQNDQPPHQ